MMLWLINLKNILFKLEMCITMTITSFNFRDDITHYCIGGSCSHNMLRMQLLSRSMVGRCFTTESPVVLQTACTHNHLLLLNWFLNFGSNLRDN